MKRNQTTFPQNTNQLCFIVSLSLLPIACGGEGKKSNDTNNIF